MAVQTVKTYVAARRLKMAPGVFREPEEKKTGQAGQLVPEAHLWVRHESWLHTGYLRLKEVSVAELEAAMTEFKMSDPDKAEVRHLLGVEQPKKIARPVVKKPAPVKGQTKIGNLGGPVPARPDRKRRSSVPAAGPHNTAPASVNPEVNKQRPAEKLVQRRSGGHAGTAILTPMRELDDDPSPDGGPKVDMSVDLTGESVL